MLLHPIGLPSFLFLPVIQRLLDEDEFVKEQREADNAEPLLVGCRVPNSPASPALSLAGTGLFYMGLQNLGPFGSGFSGRDPGSCRARLR
jgi:hypothetical protein